MNYRPMSAGGPMNGPMPQPPVPKDDAPNPAQVHIKRSIYVVVGCYVTLALMALLASAMTGAFGFITPQIMVVLLVLAPILATAGKDYLHWVASGEWNVPDWLTNVSGPKVDK